MKKPIYVLFYVFIILLKKYTFSENYINQLNLFYNKLSVSHYKYLNTADSMNPNHVGMKFQSEDIKD